MRDTAATGFILGILFSLGVFLICVGIELVNEYDYLYVMSGGLLVVLTVASAILATVKDNN